MLGYATVRDDPTIVSLASKYKVSSAQVILAWHVSRGCIVVPKSENVERQKQNLDVSTFLVFGPIRISLVDGDYFIIQLPTLAPEDIKIIDGLDRGKRLCNKLGTGGEPGKVWGWTCEQLGW